MYSFRVMRDRRQKKEEERRRTKLNTKAFGFLGLVKVSGTYRVDLAIE